MKVFQTFAPSVCIPIIVLINSASCYAFEIKTFDSEDISLTSPSFCSAYKPERYCSSYSLGETKWGTLNIKVNPLEKLGPPGKDDAIMQILNKSIWATIPKPEASQQNQASPWTFTSVGKERSLNGSLTILKYKPWAVKNNDFVGISLTEDSASPPFILNGQVGGFLKAEFMPGLNDPQPLPLNDPNNKFHWIQIISSNTTSTGFVTPEQKGNNTAKYGEEEKGRVDVGEEQKDLAYYNHPKYGNLFTPFYDTGFGSSNLSQVGRFTDLPFRAFEIENKNGHRWSADLYIAKQLEGNQVEIYDGIRWGWSSTFTPAPPRPSKVALALGDPTSPTKPSLICGRGYPISCCISWGLDYSANGITSKGTLSLDPEFQDNSIYENNATTDPTAVPSPALLPTLATAGIYHGRKWRKRKQAKKDNDIAA